MNIAVIGAGVMGSIYGGKLSGKNNVYMIDVNTQLLEHIEKNGVCLHEDAAENTYFPQIYKGEEITFDLIILFVKAMYSKKALEANKNLIGKNTYVLTLQNGAGHEDILSEFVARERTIIGTTQDNGAVIDTGVIRRGGKGITNVGMLCSDNEKFLNKVKQSFDCCGFDTHIHSNIQQLIWNKLIMNASLSATTGVLKCKIGFLKENENAKNMVLNLLHEACFVAKALGLKAEEKEFLEKIEFTTTNSKEGVTSISADMQNGRKTEVDTITGAVVKTANRLNINAPTHKFVLDTIHAMEAINDINKQNEE